ncbi:(2Fe-2S)-binding protein [Nakamurella silvestris]|nr:(2Fe-2S)-binding protein [Nakamurella silvestris]
MTGMEGLLLRLPEDYRGPLVCGSDAVRTSGTMIQDPTWMAEQLRLRGEIWSISDVPVLATLWWYSASHFLLTPTIAGLVVTGEVLSPLLPDLMLHHRPDSRVTGADSTRVVPTDDPIQAAAEMLGEMLTGVIDLVAGLSGRSARALWALATDSLANRALFFGEAIGAIDRATSVVTELCAAVGISAPDPARPQLPLPRFVDMAPPPANAQVRRLVHRQSCCLLYRVPGEQLCSSCPRRHPEDRRADLGTPTPVVPEALHP